MRETKRCKASGRLAPIALAAGLLAFGGAGCAWVEITEEGRDVQVATADQMARCQFLGKTTATTRDRVVFARSESKIASELEVLARNSAARMGGDFVAPAGAMGKGSREFAVYRCAGRDR